MPCVIYCHGNCGSRCDALDAVQILLPYNITVLAFDFSGSGLSEGEYVSLGFFEKQDLASIVEHLWNSKRVSRIGLWGRSMGAATSIMYSNLDHTIAGIVVDSPFTSLEDVMTELVLSHQSWVPKKMIKLGIGVMRKSILNRAQFDIRKNSPIEYAKNCYVPALFAHAEGDDFIKIHHSEKLYQVYSGDKNMIRFEGDHNSERPEFFYDSVTIFFVNVLISNDPFLNSEENLRKTRESSHATGGSGGGTKSGSVVKSMASSSSSVSSPSSQLSISAAAAASLINKHHFKRRDDVDGGGDGGGAVGNGGGDGDALNDRDISVGVTRVVEQGESDDENDDDDDYDSDERIRSNVSTHDFFSMLRTMDQPPKSKKMNRLLGDEIGELPKSPHNDQIHLPNSLSHSHMKNRYLQTEEEDNDQDNEDGGSHHNHNHNHGGLQSMSTTALDDDDKLEQMELYQALVESLRMEIANCTDDNELSELNSRLDEIISQAKSEHIIL